MADFNPAELRRLADAATPPPWTYSDQVGDDHNVTRNNWDVASCRGGDLDPDVGDRGLQAAADAAFIAYVGTHSDAIVALAEQAARPRRSPHWSRMLSRESAEEIADRMREVLDDHYFTLVTCNSFDENSHRFSSVDVMPSQWLTDPVSLDHKFSSAHINWATPRLAMGVSTNAETVGEAHKSGPHDYVHFTFERDRIVIDHYAPARYRLQWIFAVERHERDEF